MRPAWLVATAIAICVIVAVFARLPALAADLPPTFRRGATLVEFFDFPKSSPTTPIGLCRSGVSTGAFRAGAVRFRRTAADRFRSDGVPLDMGPRLQGDAKSSDGILQDLVAVVAEIHRHGLDVMVPLFPPSLQHELPETYLDGLDGPKFRLTRRWSNALPRRSARWRRQSRSNR